MKLYDAATLRAGYPFRSRVEAALDGNAWLLAMRDIDPVNGIDWTSTTRVNAPDRAHPAFLRAQDIVFVPRGAHFFAALVDEPPPGALAAPHLFVLRMVDSRVLPGYLVWYLNHRRAQRYFAQHAKGTSIASITRTTLANLPLVVPPLATQQRINAIAQCWQREQALQKELLEKREQWLATVLDHIIDAPTTD